MKNLTIENRDIFLFMIVYKCIDFNIKHNSLLSKVDWSMSPQSTFTQEASVQTVICYSYICCVCEPHIITQRKIEGSRNPDNMPIFGMNMCKYLVK
jgi:predicted SprT family Zn-dependent metalloprotease